MLPSNATTGLARTGAALALGLASTSASAGALVTGFSELVLSLEGDAELVSVDPSLSDADETLTESGSGLADGTGDLAGVGDPALRLLAAAGGVSSGPGEGFASVDAFATETVSFTVDGADGSSATLFLDWGWSLDLLVDDLVLDAAFGSLTIEVFSESGRADLFEFVDVFSLDGIADFSEAFFFSPFDDPATPEIEGLEYGAGESDTLTLAVSFSAGADTLEPLPAPGPASLGLALAGLAGLRLARRRGA